MIAIVLLVNSVKRIIYLDLGPKSRYYNGLTLSNVGFSKICTLSMFGFRKTRHLRGLLDVSSVERDVNKIFIDVVAMYLST